MFGRKKKIAELEKKVQELTNELNSTRSDYEHFIKDRNTLSSENRALQNKIFEKDAQLKDKEYKIAILEQYYHMDREPTDEEIHKVMVDKRVHELEMENLGYKNYMNQRLENDRFQASMNLLSLLNWNAQRRLY